MGPRRSDAPSAIYPVLPHLIFRGKGGERGARATVLTAPLGPRRRWSRRPLVVEVAPPPCTGRSPTPHWPARPGPLCDLLEGARTCHSCTSATHGTTMHDAYHLDQASARWALPALFAGVQGREVPCGVHGISGRIIPALHMRELRHQLPSADALGPICRGLLSLVGLSLSLCLST